MEQDTACNLNDFLKDLKTEYSKYSASQAKRIIILLDERNFTPNFSVFIDTEVLRQVFDVLIKNAIKYTDKGFVKMGYRMLGRDLLQFFVSDTGKGFDPEVFKKLTDEFETNVDVRPEEDITNLSTVSQLIKSLGGEVSIEYQQGMGSTVSFALKLLQNTTANESVEKPDNQSIQESQKAPATYDIWKGRTILIAEDEMVNYMFLEILFEETGAKLIHALDGQQAIDAVKSNYDIELVLMDIKMPNVNGLDATRRIKSIRPQLPVIAQTAFAMQDDEVKALQAGCNAYISKPIDVNKLIVLMKKFLTQKQT
jgi:CheY-like chemotaxis protein